MAVSAPTTQTVLGSSPIVALDPPPEGKQGVSITFTFSPGGAASFATFYQLNAPSGGLPMSQVVTLCLDNTENPLAIAVTHGAFNETVTVPGNTYLIVPTFSNKGPYPIEITLAPV